MKPMFCEEKDSGIINGKEFLAATASEEDLKVYEQVLKQTEETIDAATLPFYLEIIKLLGKMACIVGAAAFLKELISAKWDIGIAFLEKPIIPLISILGGVAWYAISNLEKKKYQKLESDDCEETVQDNILQDLDNIFKKIFGEMGVPEEANYTEVLAFKYIEKDGKIAPKASMSDFSEYMNMEKLMFSDGENLCFAETDGKYAIPLSSLKCIRTIKKRIAVPMWNKDESFKKGIYKQYKLTSNNIGMIFMKYYHILEFDYEDDTWGIYFPCYELPEYEKLTGLKAEPLE